MKLIPLVLILSMLPMLAADTAIATRAVNALGLDLLPRCGRTDANTLISPYSLQSALAMTYAGAEGETRTQMAKALHFPADGGELNRSFHALNAELEALVRRSAEDAQRARQHGLTNDPVTLTVANRLFGQAGYAFRPAFLGVLKTDYSAPFEPLNFAQDAGKATKRINEWVEEQTRQRIRNLIPDGALDALTRLVLVNAIYLKAPWADEFPAAATKPEPFHLGANNLIKVPTMQAKRTLSYARREDHTVVAVPYRGGELQFLILLPDKVGGLPDLEKRLAPESLTDCAKLPAQEVILHLPKFKLEPPAISLGDQLQSLGMRSAFDEPPGSANFNGIAPRRGEDYLYITKVFHKTFLALDEKGTEAAAATAVVMGVRGLPQPKAEPIEVRVDRPFLFAIQHRASGACLFLGRLTDPR